MMLVTVTFRESPDRPARTVEIDLNPRARFVWLADPGDQPAAHGVEINGFTLTFDAEPLPPTGE